MRRNLHAIAVDLEGAQESERNKVSKSRKGAAGLTAAHRKPMDAADVSKRLGRPTVPTHPAPTSPGGGLGCFLREHRTVIAACIGATAVIVAALLQSGLIGSFLAFQSRHTIGQNLPPRSPSEERLVVDRAGVEVFSDLSERAKELKLRYTPTSALAYLNSTLAATEMRVAQQIADGSYVRRFAQAPMSWSATQLDGIKPMFRDALLVRIARIKEEVEDREHGPFFLSEDKLTLYIRRFEDEAEAARRRGEAVDLRGLTFD